MRRYSIAPALAVLVFVTLAAGCDSTQAPLSEPVSQTRPGDSDRQGEINATGWPAYGGQAGGTQYSALDQVNTGNVGQLELAWTYRTGELSWGDETTDMTTNQATPIYNNESLYLCTPYNNIVSLNPATGEEKWRFDPKKPRTGTMYGSHVCRGVAYWESDDSTQAPATCSRRVFQTTTHGALWSVDADTGLPCTDFGKEGRVELREMDYRGEGDFASTSPPAIFKDVVIVGGTVIDNKFKDSLDGIVRGFDARSGELLWSWNPIPEHLSDSVGGANTWAPISVDVERGWVFLPTGSPSYDTYGANRKDPIPFGNAVVVLNALTGEVIWSYQTVHHDLWDYDLPAMPTLGTVYRDGKPVEAVIQPTKTGFIFVLDRETGEPLFPVEERAVPQSDVPGEFSSPTQPYPLLPEPVTSQVIAAKDAWGALVFDAKECQQKLQGLRNDGMFTPPSIKGSVLHPSFLGGTNWGGIAYDEASGLAVVNSSNLVAAVTLVPRAEYDEALHKRPGVSVYEMRDSPYIMLREALFSSLGAPCNPPPWGRLTAINMNTGATEWQIPFGRVEFGGPIKSLESWGAPNQGGPIITAGGLVFIGASLDSRFRAYELKTGKELWAASIPAPAIATPMTYSHGENGRQFIVVSAGGHGGFQTELSDAIVAFSLSEN